MKYVCPICNEEMSRELENIIAHTDIHIVDAIKKSHPHWAEEDGSCRKCYDWYKSQLKPYNR